MAGFAPRQPLFPRRPSLSPKVRRRGAGAPSCRAGARTACWSSPLVFIGNAINLAPAGAKRYGPKRRTRGVQAALEHRPVIGGQGSAHGRRAPPRLPPSRTVRSGRPCAVATAANPSSASAVLVRSPIARSRPRLSRRRRSASSRSPSSAATRPSAARMRDWSASHVLCTRANARSSRSRARAR
jgi:hypothetical protein